MKSILKHKIRKDERGFTLIELLVVVMIIGILAAVAVPQYFKVVERSRYADAAQLVGGIVDGEERYLARNGTYTAAYDQMDVQFPDFATGALMTGATGRLRYYTVALGGATGDTYVVTVTRVAPLTSRYGAYVFTYTCGAGAGKPCASAPTETTCAGTGGAGSCANDILP